jgi:beta-glucosidase-like glycosyl hydrolase
MKAFKNVAGLFIVAARDFEFNAELESFLKEFPVGGIGLFNSPHDNPSNIWTNPEAALEAVYAFSKKSREHGRFLCVDQEGGRVARLKAPFIKIPTAEQIAWAFVEKNTPAQIYSFFELVAEQLAMTGIHLNLAPVCDLRYEETSSAIGDRSFGGEPEKVIQLVRLFCEAMNSHEVSTTLKHMPGHGPTKSDSHEQIAVSLKTESEMFREDFRVFEECAEFSQAVMPGHLSYADSPDRVISLDRAHLEKLRSRLPTHLRWISDDLALMKAVSARDPWIRCFDLNYDHILLCGSLDHAAKAIEATIRHAETTVIDSKDQFKLELRIRHSQEAFAPVYEMMEFSEWKDAIRIRSDRAAEIWQELS